ncbi:hypothetical protein [Halorussus sp. AFM4]
MLPPAASGALLVLAVLGTVAFADRIVDAMVSVDEFEAPDRPE